MLARTVALLLLVSGFLAAIAAGAESPAPLSTAHWIWSQDASRGAASGEVRYFRKTFEVADLRRARIAITADNVYELNVNGRRVGSDSDWNSAEAYDITAFLQPGKNVIAVEASNFAAPDPAGFLAELVVDGASGQPAIYSTDASWKVASSLLDDWTTVALDDSQWSPAFVMGLFGKTAPWGGGVRVAPQVQMATLPKPRPAPAPFELKDGDRVVLIGATFLEREGHYGYLETALTSRFPERNVKFRNLAWSGDTVFGQARSYFEGPEQGFQRLVKQLELFKPTVAFVGYGWAESWEGERGPRPFIKGMERLLDLLEKSETRVVICTPLPHERPAEPLPDAREHNPRLQRYAAALDALAAARGCYSLDLFSVLGAGQPLPGAAPLTENGVHPTAFGYWRLAPLAARALGLPGDEWLVEIDAAPSASVAKATSKVDKLSASNRQVAFEVIDATLPRPPAPPRSPAGAGQLASPRVLRVRGLEPGKYTLRIDGQPVVTASAADWSAGVRVLGGPEPAQAEQLRQAIVEKNALFFYRWRPANETYIFGFRKGEQGRNAVEMPQFDPLIAEREQKIAELRAPPRHAYQLAPETGTQP